MQAAERPKKNALAAVVAVLWGESSTDNTGDQHLDAIFRGDAILQQQQSMELVLVPNPTTMPAWPGRPVNLSIDAEDSHIVVFSHWGFEGLQPPPPCGQNDSHYSATSPEGYWMASTMQAHEGLSGQAEEKGFGLADGAVLLHAL